MKASAGIPVRNMQPVRVFQCEIFSQCGYFSAKYAASAGISVRNIQPVRILQYKYAVSTDVPVHNIQSVRAFQQEIFSQWG
jgi:hypothetical protein